MRKNYTLSAFILGIALFMYSCGTTFYVAPETYQYDNAVSFTIQKIVESKILAVGQTTYSPPNGCKVVEIWADITNKSSMTQRIDLENILLVDTKSQTSYKPQFSLGESIGGTYGRMQPTISKGGTKSRRLAFAYPKDEQPDMLIVNGVIYHLKYTSAPPAKPIISSNED